MEAENAFSESDDIYEKTLFGNLDNGEFVTLIKPFYRKKSLNRPGQLTKSILSSSMLVMSNRHIETFDDVELIEARVEIGNASKWFYEDRVHENKVFQMPSKKSVSLSSDDGEISIISSGFDNDKTILSIKMNEGCSLKYMQDLIYKVITFISFSIGHCVQQKNLNITDIEGVDYQLVYRESFSPDSYEYKSTENAIFLYNHPDINTFFFKWSEFSNEMRPLLRLYFLPKLSNIDVSVTFILRTQLAEALAKKISRNNELTFKEYIKKIIVVDNYIDLIKRANNDIGIDDFCTQVKQTRNHLTHYDNGSESKALKGKDLFFMCFKLELLLDLFIYNYLGASQDDFDEIYRCVIRDRYNRELKLKEFKV
ncbi:hypothetical protein FRY77_04250 [Halomonas sp. MG34]|nr:hypothetical protein [Halomonas sp. MG34]